MLQDGRGPLLLVVDDEALFVSSVLDAVAVHRPDLRLIGVHDGVEALEVIDRESVDLVLTDLKMPRLDGFGLLAEMIARDARAPVIVATAFGTPTMRQQVQDLGALHTMEKPIDLEELLGLIDRLLAEPVRVRGLSLAGFAQLLGLEGKTGVLRVVATDHREGWLGFIDGRLVDAELGEARGDVAALEIFTWRLPRLELLALRPARQSVERSLQTLLLESARQTDEVGQRAHGGGAGGEGPEATGEGLEAVGAGADRAMEGTRDEQDPPGPSGTTRSRETPRSGESKEIDGAIAAKSPAKSAAEAEAERAEREWNLLAGPATVAIPVAEEMPSQNDSVASPEVADEVTALARFAASLPGVLGAAIGEARSGAVLVTVGGGLDLEVAARGNAQVVEAKLRVLERLRLDDRVEEIIISLREQYHVIRLIDSPAPPMLRYLYLVLERPASNLANIRLALQPLENSLAPR